MSSLEQEICDKSKEISELKNRLELVEKIVDEREEVCIAAEKASQIAASYTTPKVKGKKKRRKAKQHTTPSPVQNGRHVSSELVPAVDPQQEEEECHQTGAVNDKVLTADEIARLYEDYDPGDT